MTDAADWVDDLLDRLDWRHRETALLALRATLQTLRDHLPVDEAVNLGGELPLVLRGLYYDGWHPATKPLALPDRQTFLERVHAGMHRDPGIDAEQVVRGVFALLSERISDVEIQGVKVVLPETLRGLWPD